MQRTVYASSLRRAALCIALMGCAPQRGYLRVRDPALVAIEAETPTGRVCVLHPGTAPERRAFRSVNLPYAAGNNPVVDTVAERHPGGAITVAGSPVLSRDGELRTFWHYGDARPRRGAALKERLEASPDRVRVSICLAPWSRRCIAITLDTPRTNVAFLCADCFELKE